MKWWKFAGAILLGAATNAWAGSGDVLVNNAWLRESVPGQDTASLQLNLTSIKPARLVAVNSPLSAAVKIQRLYPVRGKVKAQDVSNLRLPKRYTMVFGDKDFALMLVGLKRQLNAGDRVPVSLVLEYPDKHTLKLDIEAEVRPLDLSYKHYQRQEVQDHR
ncbi:MAG: copper chaperone PCu(A)C [Nitrosomonadales bacterium]|nr:copper chaperone PCu(A)C [Nitrosomonadales bacterium]